MRVLVVHEVEKRHRELLEQQVPDGDFLYMTRARVTAEMVREADVIIGNVPPELIGGSKRLKLVQLGSAGTDGYCVPGVLAAETVLANSTGAYGLAIAEHMVGSVWMLKRKFHRYYQNQLNHSWKNEGKVTSIYGSTVLVLGLGDIGGEFAARMKGLGSYVIGIKRRPGDKPGYVDELYTMEALEDMLPRADIIALTLPGNKYTAGIIGRQQLELMKNDAILLNVGRGILVDTEALCQALQQGKLGGAALDVTEPEPLPADHPLWNAPNVFITPHVSGNFYLQETFERVIGIAAENLGHLVRREAIRNEVDFETGYKK